MLHIRSDDRVLEIGFGPGVDIRRASRLAAHGFVAGIDASAVMVRQARRNAAAIWVGKVEVRRASMDDPLPYPDASFTKIFSVNSVQFWERPEDGLGEARRVLRPGGQIAVAVQPLWGGATDETVRVVGHSLMDHLTTAGFVNVRLDVRPMRPVDVVCALGEA